MKILVLGDISRSSSCKYVCDRLWRYRKDHGIDFVIVNGENCAETNGIDKNSVNMLFSANGVGNNVLPAPLGIAVDVVISPAALYGSNMGNVCSLAQQLGKRDFTHVGLPKKSICTMKKSVYPL